MAKLLNKNDVKNRAQGLPHWDFKNEKELTRAYEFPTFADAMRFVNSVALAAEKADHHPDILISYNRVTLTLSTHSAGGLTEKDFALAAEIDGQLAA